MRLTVSNQNIELTDLEMLVAQSVDLYIAHFELSEDWDGYDIVAVFQALFDDETVLSKETALVDGECVIPWEVLTKPGLIKVGIYGTQGTQYKPTIWTPPVYIEHGVEPSEESVTPSPTIYEQLLQKYDEMLAAVPTGGEEGQVLVKKSDADRDTEWRDMGEVGTDYDNLAHKPSINGHTLQGAMTDDDLEISGLPAVTTEDNGKILKVQEGGWEVITPYYETSNEHGTTVTITG